MEHATQRVVIGMDPHKRSVTIEVMTGDETVVGGGRFGTDVAGYRSMLEVARRWSDRVWAIEGCSGIGRHVAMRLVADGEEVVDVPPKLSARTRVFATGQGHLSQGPKGRLTCTNARPRGGFPQVSPSGAAARAPRHKRHLNYPPGDREVGCRSRWCRPVAAAAKSGWLR